MGKIFCRVFSQNLVCRIFGLNLGEMAEILANVGVI